MDIRFSSTVSDSLLEEYEFPSRSVQDSEFIPCFGHCPDCVQAPFCILFYSTNLC